MIQNTQIIERLSTEQKIALVSDVSALERMEVPGLPQVGAACIDAIVSETGVRTYPTYGAMAYTWNDGLNRSVFGATAATAARMGKGVLYTPNAGIKNNPLSEGTTEDPYLAARLMDSFSMQVQATGSFPVISGGFSPYDVFYMDNNFNSRAFYEYHVDCFTRTGANAFMFPYRQLGGEYETLNTDRFNAFLHRKVKPTHGVVLCNDCPPEDTIEAITDGNILVGASVEYIRNAVQHFLSVKSKVENGLLDSSAMEEALANHSALSIEQLDEAVDRVLCLIRRVTAPRGLGEDGTLALAAAQQSVVMLKNNRILPFMGTRKITVIGADGEVDFTENLRSALATNVRRCFVDAVAGYSLTTERSDDLAANALAAAGNSDVVVIKLTAVKTRDKACRLPAGQLALVDDLSKSGKRIVAIVCGEQLIDLSFDNQVDALLLCPSVTAYSPMALATILSGKVSPSGKLANTYYVHTEEYYNKLDNYYHNLGNKVGTLVGYRYYESNTDMDIKYPFGFGLGYSTFEYADLKIRGNRVTFTVKNKGRYAAAEVPQVYIGKSDSRVIRPKKQLKGYQHVMLRAGEKRKVTIDIDPSSLTVYVDNKYLVENGTYNVYVGSSCKDIRLTGTTAFAGSELFGDGEKTADYVQSETNLLSGGYTMKQVKRKSKAGKKRRVLGAFWISLVCLAALAAIVVMYMDLLPDKFLKYVRYGLFGAPIAFVPGLLILIWGVAAGRRGAKHATVLSTGKNHESGEEQTPQQFRALFDSLYTEGEVQFAEKQDQTVQRKVVQDEFVGAFDPNITFQFVCDGLSHHLEARGIAADRTFARKILTAMCASRMILLRTNDKQMSLQFVKALANFFGSRPVCQDISGATSISDIFYEGNGSPTPIYKLLETAENSKDVIHLAYMDFDNIDNVAKAFTQLTRFSGARVKGNLSIYSGGQTQKLTLFPNIWFMLSADTTTHISTANAAFNEALCVLDLQIAEATEAEKDSTAAYDYLHQFNFYQLYKMEQNVLRTDGKFASANVPDEDKFWKKLDRLEHYLTSLNKYTYSSKLNASVERFVTVFLACKGDVEHMLDRVVMAKLALLCIGITGNDVLEEGGLIPHIDAIFGDDPADESKAFINMCAMMAEHH